MGRASLLRPSLLLPLLRRNALLQSSSRIAPTFPLFTNIATAQTTSLPPFSPPMSSHASYPSLRLFSSSSEEELKNSLKKAQDDNLPAFFYFTAVWCGPCKTISPFIEELSHKYPHVTIYKVDIDKEGLLKLLSTLKIFSVPTFHFFCNGKKETEIVGADAKQLENTMEKLYK